MVCLDLDQIFGFNFSIEFKDYDMMTTVEEYPALYMEEKEKERFMKRGALLSEKRSAC